MAAPLVNLRDVALTLGGPPLLDQIGLRIVPDERIALIGRNGEGKSTLLRLLARKIEHDSGEIEFSRNCQIGYLKQEIGDNQKGSVFEIVSSGFKETALLLKNYHQATRNVINSASKSHLNELEQAHQALDGIGGWKLQQQVERVISLFGLDADEEFSTLSGGMKRRVLLAREFAIKPDLLLLDEPTNHLDIESIDWLEKLLLSWQGALLFVTHDRHFLQRLATRIIELDRGRLTDWPGDYQNYLRRRDERAHAEAKANRRFDKKLSQEEDWIRQGIKARRKRNQGRLRQLMEMREAYRLRRSQQGQASMTLQQAERSGALVVETLDVKFSWKQVPIINNLTVNIQRGDKVGIIGPNGCGKSTLLNLLLGKLNAESGRIRRGTGLKISYFDQLRSNLDMEKSLQDNVGGGSDKVTVNGKTRHIISWLQDFLFTPDRAHQPLKALSGGERNRALLAKLFTEPANLLILDEPTNDLDIETLELLEELISEFTGTVLLVSHDRSFLDAIVTSTLVFEGEGKIVHSIGGYSDWQKDYQRRNQQQIHEKQASNCKKPKSKSTTNKLSYKLQRELVELPELIEQLESAIEEIHNKLAAPELYKDNQELISGLQNELAEKQMQLEQAFNRWEILEDLQSAP